MFDIGFSELVVIGVVALVVIGPERLPKTARTVGHLFGRLQRYVNDVKADINREMELDELRKLQREMQGAAWALSAAGVAGALPAGVAAASFSSRSTLRTPDCTWLAALVTDCSNSRAAPCISLFSLRSSSSSISRLMSALTSFT